MVKAIDKRTTRAQSNSDRNLNDTQKLRATIRRALPPVLQKLYEMALEGDTTAAKILMDRALPALAPVKEQPKIKGDSLLEWVQDTKEKIKNGEMTPQEASEIVMTLNQFNDLEDAISQLDFFRATKTNQTAAAQKTALENLK